MQPSAPVQPKLSIQELNNAFSMASKNQNLPETNGVDKIELFEVSQISFHPLIRRPTKNLMKSFEIVWKNLFSLSTFTGLLML